MYVGICTSERHLGENIKAVGEISLTVNNLKKFKYIWEQSMAEADHSTYLALHTHSSSSIDHHAGS